MNATCDCGGKLIVRTSKRLHTNRRAYLTCDECGAEYVATIQPAQILSLSKSCSYNKQARLTESEAVKSTAHTENQT